MKYNCATLKMDWLAVNHEKYTICEIQYLRYKNIAAPKQLKNGLVPYLGLELTIHVIKSHIYLARQSFSKYIRIVIQYSGVDYT